MTKDSLHTIALVVRGDRAMRNTLRSFLLDEILKGSGHVALVVAAGEETWYKTAFGDPRVSVYGVSKVRASRLVRAIEFFSVHGMGDADAVALEKKQLSFSRRYFSYGVKRLIGFLFRGSRFHAWFMRWLSARCWPRVELIDLFHRIQPDYIAVSNIRSSFDQDIVRAAKQCGIPTVGMIRNWDSLSAPLGVLFELPDVMLVPHEYAYTLASKRHRIPEKRLRVTGSPHYDWFLKRELEESRERFFSSCGIDPRKRLILFASGGVSHHIHEDGGRLPLATFEIDVVEMISHAVEQGTLPAHLHILFRPHPDFPFDLSRLKGNPFVTIDSVNISRAANPADEKMRYREEIAHFTNSLRHTACVITTTSTILIDASVYEKPVIAVAFDGYQKKAYRDSTRQFFDLPAIRALTATGGISVVEDEQALIEALVRYEQNVDYRLEGRKKIKNQFAGPLDGLSSARVAEAICELS